MELTYTTGEETIQLLTSIAEKKGEVKGHFLNKLEPKSREENRIDSVHATIFLQNRELRREKTADIIRNLSVRAPRDSIREIIDTARTYENLSLYNPFSQDSLKQMYRELQKDKATRPMYRDRIVHSYYWTGFIRMSIPVEDMCKGMNELFQYLRFGNAPLLIKSCLCHYAIQFYEPFERDNEKISRLWQTLLLMKEHPLFEFLPWEKEILAGKKRYYSRLPGRDHNTDITEFVNYMLDIINIALANLLESCRKSVTAMDRIRYFYNLGHSDFSRKDYMRIHKRISSSTASRDLDLGVERGYFRKSGFNNQTTYKCHLLLE